MKLLTTEFKTEIKTKKKYYSFKNLFLNSNI